MPDQSDYLQLNARDGTSQAGRVEAALDPDYVAVDERSLKDLLAFAREYTKELRYFTADNDTVQAVGDWRAFLDTDIDLDQVVAFMQEPGKFSPEQARRFARPHFVLFLTFLQLLRHAQDQMNTLTRRHLDFTYRQVLQMSKRPGVPDRVNVLVDLAPGTAQFRVPAGTLLDAGADSLGQELYYRTDRDLVANRAQVARLSSLFVDKRITGIRQARELHDGPKAEAFIKMLEMALGEPGPGDPLPHFPHGQPEERPLDATLLAELYALAQFTQTGLYLQFDELRQLIQLKNRRAQADPEWEQINSFLEKAGKARTKDPNYRLNPQNPRDFDANLATAMGGPPNFNTITQVENIYELYDQRIRDRVQEFIRTDLHFEQLDDFYHMMQIKVRIDNEWKEINRILRQAGERKGQIKPADRFPSGDSTAFTANLDAAVGPLLFPPLGGAEPSASIDSYYGHIQDIEHFFFMSAANFSFLMSIANKVDATSREWESVYELLAGAHREKVYAARRAHLQAVRTAQGIDEEVRLALGEAIGEAQTGSALNRLRESAGQADASFLLQLAQKISANVGVTDAEWSEVDRIAEVVQRTRLDVPVAQKVEWLNLYPAADATAVTVEASTPDGAQPRRWKTFGRSQPVVPNGDVPPAGFGWALSSPLLALSQGVRTVTLTLGFGREGFNPARIRPLFSLPPTAPANEGASPVQKGSGPFQVEISTEKGWIEPGSLAVRFGDYAVLAGVPAGSGETPQAMQFELTFAEDSAELAPLPVEAAQIDTPWPLLRLMLRQIWQPENTQGNTGRYITQYQPFKDLALQRVHVKVQARGMIPSQLQNDEHTLDANKPFEPFSSNPVAGSRLYIGHPELVRKRLDSLGFRFDWIGAPGDLAAYYVNYNASPSISANSAFTARISLIDRHLELPLVDKAPLFDNAQAGNPQAVVVPNVPQAIETGRKGTIYASAPAIMTGENVLAWNRYLQLELNPPDFQHEAYPGVAARKSVELATAIANRTAGAAIVASQYQVNPPYTPKIKQLRLDYTSSSEVDLAHYTPGASLERILHIEPFGYREVQRDGPTYSLFLPQYDFEGELYIGIQEAQPPQNLSLLLQMAEGSADPDLEPMPLQWSYLSDNRWVSLGDGSLLLDTTRGLINTGIITFALDPVLPSTLLPPNTYWIRAAIERHSNSVCDTVVILSQAVSATFLDRDNAPDHLSRPLPAASIGDLAEPTPDVAGIRQPYTSYGGKMAEQDSGFYTRISERLRHKHRALAMWDYEHIILERFPEIYKVKCLPATADKTGTVEIVVIPDIRNKLPFNPFEPKAPSNLIADIEAYLADCLPAFATVAVKNAYYVPVKVRFGVRFLPGRNPGFYKQLLNEEINHFLSPWAYDEGADIVIGGRIYANVLINFIEERPYVDYVANIKLFSAEDGITMRPVVPSTPEEGYWVETGRPDGVLVAARQHEIDMILDAGYAKENFMGINYMKIELDFIVG